MSEQLKTLKARVQHKHKTEANWLKDIYSDVENQVFQTNVFRPLPGELIIYDRDENYNYERYKIGRQDPDEAEGVGLQLHLLEFVDENINILTTSDKTVVGAINELNNKTIEQIQNFDATYTPYNVQQSAGGVSWTSDSYIGNNLVGSYPEFKIQTPFVAGENVEFEIVQTEIDNIPCYVVKINAEGGSPQTSITYSELKALRDNSELVPGMFYRITDYQCTTTQENTRAMNNQFDIIVQALDINKLSENTSATWHEGDTYFADVNLTAWELKYCLDNDTSRFAWADEENGKGVIYYMKDENNNECPYDFKNIQFKRTIKFTNGYPEVDEKNGTSTWLYTFSSFDMDAEVLYDASMINYRDEVIIKEKPSSQLCFNNVLRKHVEVDKLILTNNVFLDYFLLTNKYGVEDFTPVVSKCYSNIFGISCYNNTFESIVYCNNFGDNCFNNTFKNTCYKNNFSNNFHHNTVGRNCFINSFGKECAYNTFGDNFYKNTLGNDCTYNTFTNNCQKNVFENNCTYVYFKDIDTVNKFISNKVQSGVSYVRVKGTEGKKDVIQNITIYSGIQGKKPASGEELTEEHLKQIVAVQKTSYAQLFMPENLTLNDREISFDNTIVTTYANLVHLRDNNLLVPGYKYRITDYECTTTQTNTSSDKHSFDIIVEALDGKTLSEVAKAICHEDDTYFINNNLAAWELKYCLDNDKSRFVWADKTNGKGVIYWMKDEFNNECHYDFKNITYLGSSIHNYEKFGLDANTYYPTFTLQSLIKVIENGGDEVAVWKDSSNDYLTGAYELESTPTYNNGVLTLAFKRTVATEVNDKPSYQFRYQPDFPVGTEYTITFTVELTAAGKVHYGTNNKVKDFAEAGTHTLTWTGIVDASNPFVINVRATNRSKPITMTVSNIIIENSNGDSYSQDSSSYLLSTANKAAVISNPSTWYYWADGTEGVSYYAYKCERHPNEWSDSVFYVKDVTPTKSSIMYARNEDTFTPIESGILGFNSSYDKSIHADIHDNVINGYVNGLNRIVFIGSNNYSNTFGNGCYYNTFGNDCSSNTFGNGCSSNTFGNSCYYNTFGSESTDSEIIDYVKYIRFAEGCQYIKLINTEIASSSNYIQDVVVSAGVRGTRNSPRELNVSRNAAPVVFEAANTTHIILD